ncbi:MAG: serine hydrolase, partial [Trebonia sp.]
RWGVSSGVPSGATVALKNGWLPLNAASTDWQVNSVGWVSGDGRDYLIAVLTTGNPTEQYGISTIDALSARAWSALG